MTVPSSVLTVRILNGQPTFLAKEHLCSEMALPSHVEYA